MHDQPIARAEPKQGSKLQHADVTADLRSTLHISTKLFTRKSVYNEDSAKTTKGSQKLKAPYRDVVCMAGSVEESVKAVPNLPWAMKNNRRYSQQMK
jgi:hypothetical protein